jgi:hypothetical protein
MPLTSGKRGALSGPDSRGGVINRVRTRLDAATQNRPVPKTRSTTAAVSGGFRRPIWGARSVPERVLSGTPVLLRLLAFEPRIDPLCAKADAPATANAA